MSTGDWQEALLAALRVAVKRRMVADVPIGVLLSGGFDSSLIVALLAESGPGRRPEDVQHRLRGGGRRARRRVRVLGPRGERVRYRSSADRIDDVDLVPAVDGAIAADERADGQPRLRRVLPALARRCPRHVKVVQSGQGADEIFAGYDWYPPLAGCRGPVPSTPTRACSSTGRSRSARDARRPSTLDRE